MRSISAAEDAVLTATGGRSTRFRVKVKNAGGSFVDLSEYPGQNLCLEATWREDIDSPGLEADIIFKREVENISLAPLKTTSPLNRAFLPGGAYAALIAVAREVQIDVAITPDGVAPALGDWHLAFHGYIDEIDAGAGSNLTLRCSDLQAKLRDTFIERERAYAFAQGAEATRGCVIWRASDTHAVGVRATPTEAKKNGHFYRVTSITTGITAATEPTWPTGAGATVVDGGVTWTESGAVSDITGTAVETVMQQILDDNVGGVTLEVPSSPGWLLKAFKVDRKSVWDALRMLADQIGWDLRYKWHAGSSSFRLTFYAPDRAKTVPDRTISKSQRYSVKRMPSSIANRRNAVQVIYSDSADRDAAGIPKRKTVLRTDAASIAEIGRRFCEVSEGESVAVPGGTSNIDSSTEATTLADNLLSDLATAGFEQECEIPLWRHVELGDLIRWSADGLHYDADQDLAVTRYSHRVSPTEAKTTIQSRGKPSAGWQRWNALIDHETHSLDLGNTSSIALTTADVVGGTRLKITGNEWKRALAQECEVHVSDSAGFTPSTSTLVAAGAMNEVVIPDLIAGKTYHAKVYARGRNAAKLVRVPTAAETSFVAGQGNAAHLKQEVEWGRLPLNGGFETWNDTSDVPDHWQTFAGWGTGFSRQNGSAGVSGNQWARHTNNQITPDTIWTRDLFPVEAGLEYEAWWWIRVATVSANPSGLKLEVEWYDDTGGDFGDGISTTTVDTMPASGTGISTNTWYRRGARITAPSTAKFARVVITPDGGGETVHELDSVIFRRAEPQPKGYHDADIGVLSTTSTTYATLVQRTDFVQTVPGRRLAFLLGVSCYSAGAGTTAVDFRLKVTYKDGTTHTSTAMRFYFNEADEHHQMHWAWDVPGDVNAHGGVTVDVEWRRASGTGTISTDTQDSLSLVQVG